MRQKTRTLLPTLTSEDCVGAKISLVGRAICSEHGVVNGSLIRTIHSHDFISKDSVNILDSSKHTLSHVSRTTVAKFDSLVDTGGGA
jgi:hypothetical protein